MAGARRPAGRLHLHLRPLSVAPDGLAFVAGRTIYPGLGKDFENLWVLRLDGDGRCSDFTEWWIQYEK